MATAEAGDAGTFIVTAITSGALATAETADVGNFLIPTTFAALAVAEIGDAGNFMLGASATAALAATEAGDAGHILVSTIASGALATTEAADAGIFVATEIAAGTLATTEIGDAGNFQFAGPTATLATAETADVGNIVAKAGAFGVMAATEIPDAGAWSALGAAFGALAGVEVADAGAFNFTSTMPVRGPFAATEGADVGLFSANAAGIVLGDVENFRQRLRRLMPATWFPNPAPVLWGAISGVAYVYSSTYSLLKYAKQQMRMATTSDAFLDIAAMDYCGARIQRKPGENDTNFRDRIVEEVLRIRNTRNAIEIALMELTGRAPEIFEPWNTADTGAYNKSAFYTGNGPFAGIGHYGNLSLPFAVFVNAFRPLTPEALSARNPAQVSQFLSEAWPYPCVANVGDVGLWAIPYAIYLPTVAGMSVSDADIYSMVNNVKAAGVTAWVSIQN